MDKRQSGPFSQGLGSLEYQFAALFSGVGGDQAISLLDKLSQLSEEERKIALSGFERVVEKISAGELRVRSENDIANSAWEDSLFNDIVAAFERRSEPKFGLIHGGKTKRAALLEFSRARKERRHSIPPDAA